MKAHLATLFASVFVVAAFASPTPPIQRSLDEFETRCGWFENGTPANISLWDRDGDWTIGVQGGYQVPKHWPWPAFKSGQWVKTNGEHGHGCACFEMRVNKQTFEVLEIKSSRARPLSACRRDPALKKWHEK